MNSILGRLGIDSTNNSSKINRYSEYINNKSYNIGFENLLLTNSINDIIDSRVKASGESFKDKAKEFGSRIIDSIIALWNKFKRLFIKLKNKFLNLKLIAKIKSILKKNKKEDKKDSSEKHSEEIDIDYPVIVLVHEELRGSFTKGSKLMYSTPFLEQLRTFALSFRNIHTDLKTAIEINEKENSGGI